MKDTWQFTNNTGRTIHFLTLTMKKKILATFRLYACLIRSLEEFFSNSSMARYDTEVFRLSLDIRKMRNFCRINDRLNLAVSLQPNIIFS